MLLSTLLVAVLFSCAHCLNEQQCSAYSHPCADIYALNWPLVANAIAGGELSYLGLTISTAPSTTITYLDFSNNDRTTYLVACTAGSDPRTCDFVQPITMIVSPSTMAFNYTGLGGIGSATLSIGCGRTGSTYAACSITGGYRSTTGPSTNIVTEVTLATIVATGAAAAGMVKNVLSVYSSSSLFTYTPPGALISIVATVTDASSMSATSSVRNTATATSTPSTSKSVNEGSAGQVERLLRKAFGAGVLAHLMSSLF